jgi:hypothetical protein
MPQASEIWLNDSFVVNMRTWANSTRFRVTYLWGVTPKRDRNARWKLLQLTPAILASTATRIVAERFDSI